MKTYTLCLFATTLLYFTSNLLSAQLYCDEPYQDPGFASDPECETAVCSIDAFCCNNIWDMACAAQASSLSACEGCLTTSLMSLVSGVVFLDNNCNGVMDVGETTVENIEVIGTPGGVIATTSGDGSFEALLNPDTEYIITAQGTAGSISVSEVNISTPDTANNYTGNEIGICPDMSFHDVSAYFYPNEQDVVSHDFLPGHILTYFIHIENNSFVEVDATLTYTFDGAGLDVTQFDGGQLDGNTVTWEIADLPPLSSNTFSINLIVLNEAEIGNTYEAGAYAELSDLFPADADPANDGQIIEVNVGAPPPNPTDGCDQPQPGPGYAGFPECEAVICANDPFCCDNTWDIICAQAAAETPECASCLQSASHSVIEGVVFVDYNCNGLQDGDDFGMPEHGVESSLQGNVATSDETGYFSGYISPLNAHDILPAAQEGLTLPDPVTIITPDSVEVHSGLSFGMCPVADYQDVSVAMSLEGSPGWGNSETLHPTEEFTMELCIENHSPWASEGDLTLNFDDQLFVVTEPDGGVLSGGTVTWNIDFNPLENNCLEIDFVVLAEANPGEETQLTTAFVLDNMIPDDQNPANNTDEFDITIGTPAGFGNYCDQPQGTMGFPNDPDCEAAICAFDAFCCSTIWDGVCAASAANEPDCYFCLFSTNTAVVSGKAFADMNCDGIFNNDDVLATNLPIFRNEQVMAYSNVIGEYSGLVELNLNTNLSLDTIAGFSSNTHSVYSEEIETITGLDFALCPVGNVVNTAVTVSPIGLPPRPGFPVEYKVCAYNYSTEQVDADLTLDFSNMLDVVVLDADGGSVSGDEISWNLSNMGLFEVACFNISFEVIPGTPPGTVLNPIATVEVSPDPAVDIDLSDNEDSFSHEVVAAYDPNDKTVDQTVVNFTEIGDGEGVELNYVIRFQNTGNFFATIVRVEDQLPELLDINTIETIHASHDYELVIHPGNMVEWVFEDIMLPDSTTNEPESHGQIHFRITTVPGVSLEDVIENSASIFFDFKEPVITEPAITTFMDCSEGSLDVLGLQTVCSGEMLTLSANRLDFQAYTWSMNGQELEGSEVEITAPETTTTLTLTASHQVCQLSTTVTISVEELPAVEINIEDDLLVANQTGVGYQWYFEGELLEWATDGWIMPTQNGTYEVMVTFENGCTTSGEILFQSVGIADQLAQQIKLVPNPAPGMTQIVLPDGIWQVSLMSVSGKVLNRFESVTVNRFDLDVSSLAHGLYFVSVESEGERFVKKLVVE